MRSGQAGGPAPAVSSGDTDERWSPTTEELEAWANTVAGLDRSRRISRLLVIGCMTVALLAGSGTAAVVSANILTHAPQHVAVNASGPAVPTPTGPRLDMTAPATPPGLRLTSSAVTTITLDWDAPTEEAGVAGYIVVRDGAQIATTYQPGFTDPNLAPATTYQYSVKAFDAVGNISAPSAPVAARTLAAPDTVAPSVPTNLHVVSVSTTSIRISWSPSSDNVGVAGYDIYRNGYFVGSVGRTTFINTGLSPATVYRYQVVAFDASNNTSRITAPLTVTTHASPAPAPVPVPVPQPEPEPEPTSAPTPSPQPSSEPPSPAPIYQIISVVLTSSVDGAHPACVASVDVTVTADGPLQAQLDYTVGQASGSVQLTFTSGALSQTLRLPATGDGTIDGAASATTDGRSGSTTWTACSPPPPPPTTSPDEVGDVLEPA